MSLMFYAATKFNQDLSSWNVSGVGGYVPPSDMFTNSAMNRDDSLYNDKYYPEQWQICEYGIKSFSDYNDLKNDAVQLYTTNQERSDCCYNTIDTWGVSAIDTMADLFKSKTNFNGNIGSWNVSGVTDMNEMFKDATKFKQDLSSWNVRGVTSYSNIFTGSAMESYPNLWPRFG